MFGISGEHILILGIILLIFGPRKLPELGNTLGKAIKNFKDAVSGVEEAQFHRLPEQGPQQAPAAQTAKAPEEQPHEVEQKAPLQGTVSTAAVPDPSSSDKLDGKPANGKPA